VYTQIYELAPSLLNVAWYHANGAQGRDRFIRDALVRAIRAEQRSQEFTHLVSD